MTLLLGLAALAVLTLIVLRRQICTARVEGNSMEPTLTDGDVMVVLRRPRRRWKTGDILVAQRPADDFSWPPLGRGRPLRNRTWLIKRLVAGPGDPLPSVLQNQRTIADTRVVPRGYVVVLGDNPVGGFDSRHFGLVPANRVLGVAVRRLDRRAGSGHEQATDPDQNHAHPE
jgi:signal peptidase I